MNFYSSPDTEGEANSCLPLVGPEVVADASSKTAAARGSAGGRRGSAREGIWFTIGVSVGVLLTSYSSIIGTGEGIGIDIGIDIDIDGDYKGDENGRDGGPRLEPMGPFPTSVATTSKSSFYPWSRERISEYELKITPHFDPNKLHMPRVFEQAVAEMSNTEEVIRYLTNSASAAAAASLSPSEGKYSEESHGRGLRRPYGLLIRVLITGRIGGEDGDGENDESYGEGGELTARGRWDAILEGFNVPSFVRIWLEFVRRPGTAADVESGGGGKSFAERLFGPPPNDVDGVSDSAIDWVLVVEDATYVNLERLVRRLFADIDPNESVRGGLLLSSPLSSSGDGGIALPIPGAGMIFTSRALREAYYVDGGTGGGVRGGE